jgi:hypothetical protein
LHARLIWFISKARSCCLRHGNVSQCCKHVTC